MRQDVKPPVAFLPEGVPVFLGRCHFCLLPPEVLPSLLLFDDWDILWVRKGSLTWGFADGRSVTAREEIGRASCRERV